MRTGSRYSFCSQARRSEIRGSIAGFRSAEDALAFVERFEGEEIARFHRIALTPHYELRLTTGDETAGAR
jgi:hypothetical protein